MTQITLADGRRLDVRTAGPEGGPAVVFHHGTPMSAGRLSALDDPITARGMRLVTWSRPGYGTSTRHPGRDVVDVVGDTEEVLDALGIEHCVTVGWSGGGPHALACAARLRRCTGALVIAGIAPRGLEDLDWLGGMGEGNLAEFGAALTGEAALRAFLEPAAAALGSADLATLLAEMASVLPEVDRRQLADGFGPEFVAAVQLGLAHGFDGWCDDDLAFVRDWGFDLAEIDVPVTLWQGDADLMVPADHAPALGRRIPGARLHTLAEEGHISIALRQIESMLDELAAGG